MWLNALAARLRVSCNGVARARRAAVSELTKAVCEDPAVVVTVAVAVVLVAVRVIRDGGGP